MTTGEVVEQTGAGGGARRFEWWMLANPANGAGYYSFAILDVQPNQIHIVPCRPGYESNSSGGCESDSNYALRGRIRI